MGKHGKRKTQDVPFVSYGKDAIDFSLSLHDDTPVIDMDFIASRLDEKMAKQGASDSGITSSPTSRADPSAGKVVRVDDTATKRSVVESQTAESKLCGGYVLGSDSIAASSTSCNSEHSELKREVDIEEQRRQMREARLRRLT